MWFRLWNGVHRTEIIFRIVTSVGHMVEEILRSSNTEQRQTMSKTRYPIQPAADPIVNRPIKVDVIRKLLLN